MFHRVKIALVTSVLQPHQIRVLEKLRASGGVLAAHGVGSGKTLEAIAAQDQLDMPTDVVVPAPLIANYHKELAKHVTGPHPETRVRSYEKTIRDGGIDKNRFVIADEAHRMRNPGSSLGELSRQMGQAKARLLLTGTPVYNHPADLAGLLNTAAGKELLPYDRKAFEAKYIEEKKVDPGFIAKLRGAQPASYSVLKNKADLVRRASGYVDVHSGGGENFPSVESREVEVPMSQRQHQVYKFLEGKLPWHLRMKVKMNLPLSKAESSDLNHFFTGMRQVSNSPFPFENANATGEHVDPNELDHAPKLKAVIDRIKEMRTKDPNYRGVVYSNYLDAGLNPLARQLHREGINHALFTGEVSKIQRKKLVGDYNEGRLPVLMISSSGAEGLDLKGTKHVSVVEPHFNESKIQQIIGRGARYMSHAHLPEAERKVMVDRYFSTRPKPMWGEADTAVERFLQTRSNEKQLLNKQIMEALQEASDQGPLKRLT